ncbi:PepSY-associated TM helix domain-containing protein [Alteriqipengyuania lutimaris]|uniref:PepSY domain-containing protein n=1 Tax=Alteriqipengyuania lutimaris TaxID=1538146 RepID=A0A395LHF3_9SPHN|nr:PepSY domain-containing protein [Alteriqipengyuania lutimaris]MBB3034875.1 putative iron-regulated membrane protein [Alteriqipengyuania lutimaris]RDS76293.1 PepSY domain-containing protein [Alteriqipengyuania lutimaris]
MSRRAIRFWYLIHKWSSLIPTLFLLMLCVTGLPLIFHDEIDAAFSEDYERTLAGAPSAEAGLPLDTMLARALAERPGEVPLFMAFSQDSPLLTVTTGPTPEAPGSEMTLLFFDRATGASLGPAPTGGVMETILHLHTDMLLGLPGMLFLGVMGLSFVVALVSGTVLYAPFMRKLRFGTLRLERSKRVGRLDQHNLLGIVILAWALVIGLTGAINAFADPLTDNWRNTQVAQMTAAYADASPLAPADYGSLDAAMASARARLPGRNPQFIGFPGGAWSSGHHYAIFFQGDRPATQYLLTPALVDARTGELTDVATMPAINQALMMSKPLHFGDYAGLPLKIVWALLTLATIWVLWTGVLLWFKRRPGAIDRRIAEIDSGGFSKVPA